MALGDEFPTELINTTDLRISRPTFSTDWADEATGLPTTTVGSNLSAIVVPARQALIRNVDGEEVPIVADVILNGADAPKGIAFKDVVRWTDFYGTTTDAEVEQIERVSGSAGLEHIVLSVGRRTA